MSKRLSVETPQRVTLDYEIVGLGTRVLAFLADSLCLLMLWILLLFLLGLATQGDALGWFQGLGGLVKSLLLVGVFLINWGYGLLFEWAWSGQTPGKRLLQIRVQRRDGRPYTLGSVVLRNLSRVVDGFPLGSYAVGLFCVLWTREHQRLGDLLAGTVLVTESAKESLPLGPENVAGAPLGVSLSTQTLELLRSYLERRETLDPEARLSAALATEALCVDSGGKALAAGAQDLGVGQPQEAGRLAQLETWFGALIESSPSSQGAGGALVRFEASRRSAWQSFEQDLDAYDRAEITLERLDRLDRSYRSASADLAWLQVVDAESRPAKNLQLLVTRAFRLLYWHGEDASPDRRRSLVHFFSHQFPAAVWRLREELQLACFVFVLSGLVGALLVLVDPSLADPVLGPVLMEKLRAGQTWTDDLLVAAPPALTSTRIATNNLSVCLSSFAGGLGAGIWTLFLLVLNGGLLGVAFAATANHGLAASLLDFTLAHGPVEVSVILLSSAAGLRLARAMLDPGERTRVESLRTEADDALRVLVGSVPLLVLVGMVESFVSPGAIFPLAAKAALGLTLFGLLWAYLLGLGPRAAAEDLEHPEP